MESEAHGQCHNPMKSFEKYSRKTNTRHLWATVFPRILHILKFNVLQQSNHVQNLTLKHLLSSICHTYSYTIVRSSDTETQLATRFKGMWVDFTHKLFLFQMTCNAFNLRLIEFLSNFHGGPLILILFMHFHHTPGNGLVPSAWAPSVYKFLRVA